MPSGNRLEHVTGPSVIQEQLRPQHLKGAPSIGASRVLLRHASLTTTPVPSDGVTIILSNEKAVNGGPPQAKPSN